MILCSVPHGHSKTTTLVAALRCDEITAPYVFNGPMKGECFLAHIEQCLGSRTLDTLIAAVAQAFNVSNQLVNSGLSPSTLKMLRRNRRIGSH
jgi:hypothetical protein